MFFGRLNVFKKTLGNVPFDHFAYSNVSLMFREYSKDNI